MSRQATRITAQNLSERISISNEQDELGHLAGVLNSLLARLDDSFEQQRRFMADASHELRTPIAIIRGESEVALSRTDRSGGDYRESLKIVQEESKRLTHLVEDLFTLARIDAGEFRANFTLVYLDEIVAEAVKAVRSLAREKRVSIEFEADAEMPMTGDDAMLRRLFVNLLDNAIKYNTENGSVMVSCRSESGKYNVSVSDTGSGIPPAERGRVFERFYRVDKARGHADEAGGAGLGLSIARWIAEIHGADIRLSSSVDNGSVFTVNFPAYK
jgi:heavy metal sensor kinase